MTETLSTDWQAQVAALARFSGGPAPFWEQFRAFAAASVEAREAWVYTRGGDGGWTAVTPGAPAFDGLVTPDLLRTLAVQGLATGTNPAGQGVGLATIPMGQAGRDFVLLVVWPRAVAGPVARLATLATIPVQFESGRRARAAARDAQRFGQALALTAAMMDADSFGQAASVLVNRLSELMACETVFLCWRAREGQRLHAVSHGEKPDRRSQESALVEEVAQEALTQQAEVTFPPTGRAVAFAAGRFAELAKPGHVITLPMIRYSADGKGTELGAVTLCRKAPGFTEAEQWALRLMMEMGQPVLEARAAERLMLPHRLAHEIGRSLPKALRARTVPGKALLALGLVALVGLAVMPVPFRIHASAVVRTDAMGFVGAPFSGYVEASDIILGDTVTEGQPLFRLSVNDLNLERDGLLAELAQANRDAEVNRSLRKLPEMLVAQARAEEIKSRLIRLDRQIASAQAVAPLSGVVIEGEPAKRIGQAVNRGDAVVTVAALSGMYVEAAVSERDLAFVAAGQTVELTLLASPKDDFALSVREVIPAASVQDADNVFPVRLSGAEPPDWWLPGMTGVVRIDVGRASLAWVASRRLLDMVRLKLWI
ncbi:efflux RND transporter periplasmic adaptor subunit [Sagittula sp. S175]|uniref:efflux RND transporter periplasmic adaptor subunit n=1 Tax=Sagittula sp. S175 TaxID=3415129 RepID=UPI003C7AF00D